MRNYGGWLSPDGRLLWSTQSHVVDMIGYPRAFGLTRAYVDAAYRAHGEPVGQEGKAREKLIQEAVAAHWVRFRRYQRGEARWSVTLQELDGSACRRITGLFLRLVQGTARGRESHLGLPVRILEVGPDIVQNQYTVGEIAGGALIGDGGVLPEPLAEARWVDLDT